MAAGKTLEVYVKVELKFTNVEMTLNLLDHMTEDFKQFNAKFKSEMKTVYSGLSAVPGYKDVIIRSIRQGSVIVEHDVVAEIEFKSDENITGQYDRTLQAVKRHLEELTSSNCTYGTTPMCMDGNIPHVLAIPPRSEEELCRELVPDGYTEFYSPVLSSDGLSCVSRCHLRSPNYLHCNDGVCQVERATGPQCFCSRTDLYIYSTSQCSGRIAKLDLYVGGGVTIGVLVIIIVTLIGFYLYRVKLARPKPFLTEDLYFTTGNIDQ
ncbi:mucin-3A-like [Hyperolius riggenbachi]|uniref:mucin-3A-like n=1 Tax=Hyperolius riggenbachi TaxID=752182 RepID=UPI0035A3C7C7